MFSFCCGISGLCLSGPCSVYIIWRKYGGGTELIQKKHGADMDNGTFYPIRNEKNEKPDTTKYDVGKNSVDKLKESFKKFNYEAGFIKEAKQEDKK